MTKQKTIHQLVNLINNLNLSQDQKSGLLDYFSLVAEAKQYQIYLILLETPEFIGKLSQFIDQEKKAIDAGDEEELAKIFAQEFSELEKHI